MARRHPGVLALYLMVIAVAVVAVRADDGPRSTTQTRTGRGLLEIVDVDCAKCKSAEHAKASGLS